MRVVFDLDGTLALAEHRQHHLLKQPKDWDAWHAECGEDTPCQPLLDVMAAMVICNHDVEIWTGRGEQVKSETLEWFRERAWFDLINVKLIMREKGDFRPDTELKREWYDAADPKPDLIFEDRARVVKMWRGLGVVCCQVAEGEF